MVKKAPSRERRKPVASPAGAKKEPAAKPLPERSSMGVGGAPSPLSQTKSETAPRPPAPIASHARAPAAKGGEKAAAPAGGSGLLIEVEERVRRALALLED